ncbi:MAG: hypothetical protein O4751_09290 [Trichodesmium sp. St2_bin6]|nr:hypothetical protein [Trichodesmium sp. St2_bin6]
MTSAMSPEIDFWAVPKWAYFIPIPKRSLTSRIIAISQPFSSQ